MNDNNFKKLNEKIIDKRIQLTLTTKERCNAINEHGKKIFSKKVSHCRLYQSSLLIAIIQNRHRVLH